MAHIAVLFPLQELLFFNRSEQIELALPDSSDPFVLPSVSSLEKLRCC